VHTLILLGTPSSTTRMRWTFGFQRRRVTRWECEMLLPKAGALPQTSHTDAIVAEGYQSLPPRPLAARDFTAWVLAEH
jgi:hypothetical protein